MRHRARASSVCRGRCRYNRENSFGRDDHRRHVESADFPHFKDRRIGMPPPCTPIRARPAEGRARAAQLAPTVSHPPHPTRRRWLRRPCSPPPRRRLSASLLRLPNSRHPGPRRVARASTAARRAPAPVRRGAALRTAATSMPGLPTSGLKDLRNCIEAQQFDRAMLEELFVIADAMAEVRPGSDESRMLQGYLMSTLFYEPSTRTRLSFEGAMGKLGGGISPPSPRGGTPLPPRVRPSRTPSAPRGYSDIIVLRHFTAGAARRAANAVESPVINAGDGPGQHPTQALLDAYTIYNELGRVDDIKVGLVGRSRQRTHGSIPRLPPDQLLGRLLLFHRPGRRQDGRRHQGGAGF